VRKEEGGQEWQVGAGKRGKGRECNDGKEGREGKEGEKGKEGIQ
jgi:hypothetical protein